MNKNVVISVVVVVALAILLVNIQLPIGEEKNAVNGSTNSSINSTVRESDRAYLKWAEVTFKSMRLHVSDITNATNADNYSDIEMNGSYLSRDAEISLNQSKYLEVSPGLESSRSEIQSALEDYIVVGKYVETGGKNQDDESLIIAASYAKNASDHMTNASLDVRSYMRTLK